MTSVVVTQFNTHLYGGQEMTESKIRVERCETCDAWERLNEAHGECRARPPAPRGIPQVASWMRTGTTDWCREWRKREQ